MNRPVVLSPPAPRTLDLVVRPQARATRQGHDVHAVSAQPDRMPAPCRARPAVVGREDSRLRP